MSLVDAIVAAGPLPKPTATRAQKKRFSEILSRRLAEQVGAGLRAVGFKNVKPFPGRPGERAFQGGLGTKKVDVSYADDQHGLLLAVSIKTINSPPFGKNLKNRFADLCTEAITLHMRFPYGVVCALFAFPAAADDDVTRGRPISTFRRAMRLMATLSGRGDHADAGEKFENVTMMLFQPPGEHGRQAGARLFNAKDEAEICERDYFLLLRDLYNHRNPHAPVGEGNDHGADEE